MSTAQDSKAKEAYSIKMSEIKDVQTLWGEVMADTMPQTMSVLKLDSPSVSGVDALIELEEWLRQSLSSVRKAIRDHKEEGMKDRDV